MYYHRSRSTIRILVGVMLSLTTLAGLPSQAAEVAEESAVQAPIPTRADPNQRVCRKLRITSSNIPRRVCLTRAQWAQLQEEGQRTAQLWREAGERRFVPPQ